MGRVCSRHSRERSFNQSNKNNNNMEMKNVQCVVVVMTLCLVLAHADHRTQRDELNLLEEISEIFAEKMEKREDCPPGDGGYACSSNGDCCSNDCSLGTCRYTDTGGRRLIGGYNKGIGGREPAGGR